MTPLIETVSGSPYELGKQQGRIFRHVIRADIHQWAMRHDFQGSDAYLDEHLATRRSANAALAPWLDEELLGIAEGSGVDVAWVHRLNLRVWEVPVLPHQAGTADGNFPGRYRNNESCGCTSIGVITESDGVGIGGTLDDARSPYVLLRRVPKEGLVHVTVARAGGIWNQNGMNEAGLFMAANGMGKHPDFKDPDPAPALPNGTVNRLILQTCRTVPEALQLIQASRTSHSYVLGDALGNLAAVQVMGSLFDCQFAGEHGNLVFCTNHAFMPGLVGPLREQACEPYVAEKSRVRFEVLLAARRELPKTPNVLRSLLLSHDGFPNSICNNLSALSMLASPQKDKNTVWIADSPPCRNPYSSVSITL